ncbi:MAG TPA: hypothetical protein PKV69_01960, partial [Candidatus Hydrogenedentes bacterium]|nr:hypothetical protein [Candidatus Hydrogenedentota bacterium]
MRLHRVHAAVAGFVAVFSAVLGGAAWDAAAVCPLPSDPQQQLEIVISIVDVNRDGGLSLAEIQALYPGMTSTYFTFADGNRDGKITAAELMPWLSLLPGMNLLGLVDVNLNRAIEYSEVAAYVTPEQFALVDINGDGVVDCLDIGGGPVEGEGEDPVEGEGEDPGDPPCPIGDVTADTLVELVLILVDTSGDGSLSLGEVRAVYPELESVYFTLLDSNRNGLLDAAELAALTAFLPLDDFLGEVDLNGDGLVAYAEVSQYVTEAQFALADLNGNGFVDCEDIDLLTGGTDPGEGEGEDPVEGEGEDPVEGEPGPPCPIDFSIANIAAVVVSLLDTDGNGGLSLAEIEAIYPDMEAVYFTILDSNRDGKITAAELAAIATILPVDSYIGMVDPNGDGLIAYAEVSGYLTQAQFDLIDTNHNGVIDCVDVAALTGGVVPVEGEPEGEGEDPVEGEGEGEDPVEGEGEPVGPCPIDFSNVLQTLAPVVVSLLDSNGDGGVSLAEIQTVYPEMEAVYFTLLDANRDGKITASELSAVVGILPVGSFIGMIDPNGDGLIAYSEVSQYLSQSQFDLVDTNNNGVIDCVDVAALTGGVIPGEGEPEGEPGEGEGEPGTPCPVLDALDIP